MNFRVGSVLKLPYILFFTCLLQGLTTSGSWAQTIDKFEVGIGGGLDYGGLGARLTFLPSEFFGVFGAAGYNLHDIGYNLGLQARTPFKKRWGGYFTAMYGYNAVLQVEGLFNKTSTTYYGFTTGVGAFWRIRKESNIYINAELLLPFRPAVYHQAIDDLKMIGYDLQEPLDVGFSIGIHYRFVDREN